MCQIRKLEELLLSENVSYRIAKLLFTVTFFLPSTPNIEIPVLEAGERTKII